MKRRKIELIYCQDLFQNFVTVGDLQLTNRNSVISLKRNEICVSSEVIEASRID